MMIGIDDYFTVPAAFFGTAKDNVSTVLLVFLFSLFTAMVLTELRNNSR